VNAFQILPPFTIHKTTKSTTTSTLLKYRDGPEVDLYEPVTAELLRPDVAVPPEAKRVHIVTEKDEAEEAEMAAQEASSSSSTSTLQQPPSVWETSKVHTIEGGCLKTFTMENIQVEHVQLLLRNDGGTPLNAKADVFCGPGSPPMQLAVYSDDGARHPFSGVICTPYMVTHSIGVKNSGPIDENPMKSVVMADMEHIYNNNGSRQQQQQRAGAPSSSSYSSSSSTSGSLGDLAHSLLQYGTVRRIQGGQDEVFAFHKPVESVQILLKTDGRPCQARIELCSDGDHCTIAQVVEVYSEDGQARPFFAVLDTPGLSNMVRVVNVGDPSFPISACVEPFMVDADYTTATSPPPSSSSSYNNNERYVQEIGRNDFDVPPNMGQHPRPSPPPPPSPGPYYPDDPFIQGGDIGIPGIEDDVGFFFVDRQIDC
jgi:hypothetical protein